MSNLFEKVDAVPPRPNNLPPGNGRASMYRAIADELAEAVAPGETVKLAGRHRPQAVPQRRSRHLGGRLPQQRCRRWTQEPRGRLLRHPHLVELR